MGKRIEAHVTAVTGQGVLRVWYARSAHQWQFVTVDDVHGWYDKKTSDWGWLADQHHYHLCGPLFHWAIPRGHLRLKMIVEPGLVTPQFLRHCRAIMRTQATDRGYTPVGGIHARHATIPMTPQRIVVLEIALIEGRLR